MAEVNSEILNIRLHVYDDDIPVTIHREDEVYYRAAAKQITDRYNAYAKAYKGFKNDHTVALMTLVDIALTYQREHSSKSTTPYVNMIDRLTSEIEDALK